MLYNTKLYNTYKCYEIPSAVLSYHLSSKFFNPILSHSFQETREEIKKLNLLIMI